MARLWLQALLVSACALAPRFATAQVAAQPAAQAAAVTDGEAARQSFRDGVAFSEQLRWADAERAFARSADLAPSASCLLNLAVTRFRLQLPLEGLAALERIEQLAVPISPEQTERALGIREQLERDVATVRLELKPREASVALDGKELPATAVTAPLRLNPGRHVLVARAADHLDATVLVELSAGETRTAELLLAPTPASAARATAPSLPGPRLAAPVVGARPDRAPVQQRSLLTEPWFWVGAGAVVVASVVVAGVALSSKPQGTAGSEGHVF